MFSEIYASSSNPLDCPKMFLYCFPLLKMPSPQNMNTTCVCVSKIFNVFHPILRSTKRLLNPLQWKLHQLQVQLYPSLHHLPHPSSPHDHEDSWFLS